MDYTYFYIKLFNQDDYDNKIKIREFNSTIKLQYPIRGAKFLKIYNIFSNDIILLVKCDLIDQTFSYTNIRDSTDYNKSSLFNSQIVFVGCGESSDEIIKIDKSKSLINEFTISVKKIDNSIFNMVEIPKAFIKIKIYHES